MTSEDIARKVITQTIDIPEHDLRLRDMLFSDLHMDALDTIELVMRIEENIGKELPDNIDTTWHTVKDIVACIEHYRS